MIKASEIKSRVDELKQASKELKEAEELKKKNDRINAEMLEIEKAINKYNRDLTTQGIDKLKNYISIPITVCKDVENILKDWGYIIDIADFNDIRLYYDESDYIINGAESFKDVLNSNINKTIESVKTSSSESSINENNILKVYDKVRKVTGKEPIVFGSRDDLSKLHNRKVEDECTVTKDEFSDLLKNCIIYRF